MPLDLTAARVFRGFPRFLIFSFANSPFPRVPSIFSLFSTFSETFRRSLIDGRTAVRTPGRLWAMMSDVMENPSEREEVYESLGFEDVTVPDLGAP